MNILHITSSARGSASYSNRVAAEVIDELKRRNPGASVTLRDLAREPLPHIDDDFVAATRSPDGPQTERQRALLAQSDALVDELFAADVIVIAAPMINFTIPSTLKTWIDYVARAGPHLQLQRGGTAGARHRQAGDPGRGARRRLCGCGPGARLPGAVSQERARLPRHDRRDGARGRGHGVRAGRRREGGRGGEREDARAV